MNKIEGKYNVMRFHMKKIAYHSNIFQKNVSQNNRISFIVGRLQKIKNIELTALKSEQCAVCPMKPVKHYFFSSASIAEWFVLQTDTHTASVRVSSAAKLFRQMHAKINIFYTVLVQNMKTGNYIGKLTRQTLDSTGIVNNSHVFFSVQIIKYY